jgi:hypothetical protein
MIALDDMSEKEAVHCLTKLKAQMRIILITKKIQQGSKAVLPAVKIIKLRKSEEGFNRKLCINTESSKKIIIPHLTSKPYSMHRSIE